MMRSLLLLSVLLLSCSLAAATTCYDASAPAGLPKVGDCVASCTVIAGETRSVNGLCTGTPATPVCCLAARAGQISGRTAPATPAAPVAPVGPAAPAAPVTPPPSNGPFVPGKWDVKCIVYSNTKAGTYNVGVCGDYTGGCPTGTTVSAGSSICQAYSDKKKCCLMPDVPAETFVVPARAAASSAALQPADVWRLEFVDDGKGAQFMVGSDGKRVPYAEGFLQIKNSKGEVIDSFSAVSGPMNRGLLPNESQFGYTVSLKEAPNAQTGFPDQVGFGFKFFINPNKAAGFTRSSLLVHTASAPFNYGTLKLTSATEGCIGLNGAHERNLKFYNTLQDYLNRAKTIRLDVKIAGNPNVGGH